MSLPHVSRTLAALVCLAFLFVCALTGNALAQYRFDPQHPEIGTPSDADVRLSQAAEASALRPDGAELDPSFAPLLDNAYGFVNAIEQQPDGKVLVGGGFRSVSGHPTACMLRLNADRSIDTTFSSRIRGQVLRIFVLPDQKILIAGPFSVFNATTSRLGIARLNPDGSLDPTFNAGPDSTSPRDIRVQADGKILIAGEFTGFSGISRNGIARLNADGSVDGTFTSPFQLQFPTPTGTPPQSGVQTVGIQPDGKIIVAGFMQFPGDGPGTRRWVVRLNTDGTPDGTFNIPTMGSNASELDIQPDGKIVLVGFFTSVNSVSRNRIARLNADGTLDDTFNPGTGANASVGFVRVLASGKVLIAGGFTTINAVGRGGVALLNSNGSLDDTFTPGTTTGSVSAAFPISGGGYYVGGSFSRIAGTDARPTLAVLDAGGVVDPGFAVTSYTHPNVRTIGIQPDGKIIAGGSFNRLNGASRTSLVRFNPNGTPDLTFDSGELVAVSVFRIAFQPDGKFLVLGTGLSVNGGGSKTMVRLNANGTVDNTFNLATIAQIGIGLAAAVQPDGKILFSYQTTSTSPLTGSGIVRLNTDGSLDGTFTGSFPSTRFESLAVLPNGQILAAGPFAFAYVSSQTGSEPHAGVLRMNSDGTHDRTFRSALTFDEANVSSAFAMHVQADGRILVAGRLFIGNAPTAVGVARLNSTGTIDGSFQTGSISSLFGIANVFAMHVTADGKIIAGGFFDTYGGNARGNLVRLDANGAVDETFSSSTDYTVSAITTQANGSILIGGSFEKVNGVSRTAIARLLTGPARRAPFDFDGDGKTDIGIFRPVGAASEWWVNRSSTGQTFALQFGASTDQIAPADYTGDGKTDIAFFRPSSGEWYVLRSEDFSFFALPFGTNGDIPVPADYDADGKTDFAVYRPSSSTWFISQSSGAPTRIVQFGVNGDQPVVADYDGDGKADIGVFRQAAGGAEWWIDRSTAGSLALQFGANTDKAVQGDYTGDGKADIAVWKPSTGEWFIVRSEDLSFYGFPFGASGDVSASGDYDGDGKFDATVFRPSNATWFIARTTAGTQIVQFGATGDRPIPNAFVP